MTITSEIDGNRAMFRYAVLGAEMTTETDGENLHNGRRTISLPSASRGRELCQILDTPGRDRLYERALPTVQAVTKQIETINRS